jgi:hypothetical protein
MTIQLNSLCCFRIVIANGLLLGISFQLATPFAMKLFHNYDLPPVEANEAAHWAGIRMLASGGLAYLTVFQQMSLTKAIRWSLVPMVLGHVLLRDVLQENNKKLKDFKGRAGAVGILLAALAYSLITGSRLYTNLAAMILVVAIGVLDVFCILFPRRHDAKTRIGVQIPTQQPSNEIHHTRQWRILASSFGTVRSPLTGTISLSIHGIP